MIFRARASFFLGDIVGAQRSGQGSFIFPIGNNGKWRPVGITAASATAPTDASYFALNPGNGTLPLGGPFSPSLHEARIRQIITLRIVAWDGTKWLEIPSSVDETSILNEASTLEKGSITTTEAIVPNKYQVYSLAALIRDTDGDGVTDGVEATDGTDLLDPCSYKAINQDYSKTSAAWRALDCDGDELKNGEEVDPDGDGTPGPDGLDPLVPNSTIALNFLAYNDKNNNCSKDSGENEIGLPSSGLFIKVFDLDNNLLYKREVESGQFEVVDFTGATDVIYYYIIDTNDSASDITPNLPEGANGGFYPEQIFKSTGISGLTAKLESGSFSDDSGSLTFKLSGAPTAGGKGIFNITIGGVNCQLEFTVIIPTIFTQDLNVTSLNTPISGNLSINDVVPGGATYKIASSDSSNPVGGELKIKADGTYTFVGSKVGVYRFKITICDLVLANVCSESSLQITVLDPNSSTNPPVANPDLATTVINTPVRIAVLANDQSGNLKSELVATSLSIIEQPKNGKITINSDGSIIFTPNAGFIGSDSFEYRICDSAKPENCQSASVSIQVLADRIVPTTSSVDDYVVVRPNSKAQRFLSGNVLDNDHSSDPNVKLTASLITGPASNEGTLVFNADGSFTFTAAAGFSGTIGVVYMVCDNSSPANCSFATLHILVEPGDFDGDGVGDLQEAIDGTNPKDACSFKLSSQTFIPSAAWSNADCDGDGVINAKEKSDATNPLEPCDFKLTSRTLTPSEAWRNGDCDKDGLSNDVDGIEDCDKDGVLNFLDHDTCKIDILMANVFTPNGDGINDVIKPVLLGIEKFVCLKIYNRWGNIIFESKDRDKGWDGDFRTQGQGTETFQWIAEGYDRDGK
ncbi:hypothetical protein GHT06_004502 [Daphnia sinensis]|uniref:Tandem-95 repeat protein n=1 Tax=Daphnia sinensis TaxID=1820382 RepID=A0AAD5PKZ2_9CRUS|nr:hypothetical protein GHT06_004502 [Daphnia sinensis]